MRYNFIVIFLSLLYSGVIGVSYKATDKNMDEIKKLNLPGVTITELEDVPAGNFTPAGGEKLTSLPSFVRVAFISKPTPESNIRIELWMPKETWNGRFLGTGNGGGAGQISYSPLISGIMRGFATANTDMGTSPNADEIIDYPERWADFGYRSTHLMTVFSKAILEVYYKKPARYSYFSGCSTGGEQALMEAQRYPDDYNGIIAGAPANNRTHLHSFFVWNLIATNHGSNSAILTQKKMEFLSGWILKKYRGKDGGAPSDNFLTDPRICKFNPEMLPTCSDGVETDSCFSKSEIAALKKLYAGPINSRTGDRIYSPLPLGGTRLESTSPHFYLFKWIFGKNFDYTTFDFDHDMKKIDSILGPILNANNPDLHRIKNLGGKILMYAGTVDQLVPAPDAINYYERVIKVQGGLKKTQDFFRFFLVPGMEHCGGGPGLTDFGQWLSPELKDDSSHDILTTMINWVEREIVPEKIIATAFNCCDPVKRIRFQRPIFPYPKFPHYIGGDPNSASSYRGVDHRRGITLVPDKIYLK